MSRIQLVLTDSRGVLIIGNTKKVYRAETQIFGYFICHHWNNNMDFRAPGNGIRRLEVHCRRRKRRVTVSRFHAVVHFPAGTGAIPKLQPTRICETRYWTGGETFIESKTARSSWASFETTAVLVASVPRLFIGIFHQAYSLLYLTRKACFYSPHSLQRPYSLFASLSFRSFHAVYINTRTKYPLSLSQFTLLNTGSQVTLVSLTNARICSKLDRSPRHLTQRPMSLDEFVWI